MNIIGTQLIDDERDCFRSLTIVDGYAYQLRAGFM
jgi:hypothetical protein